MKTGPTWMHRAAWGVLLLSGGMLCWASGVHTNPLNNDPLVRAAYEHFYNLDYPGAVERLERFHAAHPGDPQGTVLLLEAVVFQELYRQDLLDTTFYANDGFLTGRHATAEDPAIRDRILALADEAVQERQADRREEDDHEEHRVDGHDAGEAAVVRDHAGMRPLVHDPDEEEEPARREAVVDRLEDAALDARVVEREQTQHDEA